MKKAYNSPAIVVSYLGLDQSLAVSISGVTTSSVADTAAKTNWTKEAKTSSSPFDTSDMWQ